MGGWHRYCAICGGPLNLFDVEFANPAALANLPKHAALNERRLREEKPMGWEEEMKKFDHATLDASYQYDPAVLDKTDIEWLGFCRALGRCYEELENGKPEYGKGYITRRGTYGLYGEFVISRDESENESSDADIDPNDPLQDSYECYEHGADEDGIVFPFHETCFSILALAIYDEPTPTRIDKEAMYTAMKVFNDPHGHGNYLELDYGMGEQEQYWTCYHGEEYVVCDPALKNNLISRLLPLFPPPAPKPIIGLSLNHKVRSDPFSKLPYDILLTIFPYLSPTSALALMCASWHVHTQTRSFKFWEWMIRTRPLKWFPEVAEILEKLVENISGEMRDVEARRLFLWAEFATVQTRDWTVTGPLMGIANRRRIMKAIQPIVPVYLAELQKAEAGQNGSE
ncbi:hypothetical protein DM02DRAFT_671514 [Periconia macrospinosa]|uniref:F-box domain-containing protein n=1 Tax=Periconia macrospinosa TaxID=97972 RepID=A0A2V1DS92_9PLEO|nr:hypothetical protein DM02DRAFT_671514 [Periconia macrospinosa]